MYGKKPVWAFRLIRGIVRLVYPKIELEGTDAIPGEAVVFVGNHCQMNGPIVGELYMPVPSCTWCAGEMMALREVPAYAYRDFWSKKPRAVRWLYRIASYLIAPLSVLIFNNAATIPVYRDNRIITTFRTTIDALAGGASVVIFPEHEVAHNRIIYDFQDRFIDLGRMYYKRTGKALVFVPMYLAPRLRKLFFGAPVAFDPDAPIAAERERIKQALMARITEIAEAQPLHTVIPYPNLPKRQYPTNREANQ